MAPLLPIGSSVFYQVPTRTKIGDIIIFESDNRLKTVHRVINISSNKLTTKGDNRNQPDTPITQAQVIGQVTKVTVNGKTISLKSFKGGILNYICILYSALNNHLLSHHPVLAGKIKFKFHQLVNQLFF